MKKFFNKVQTKANELAIRAKSTLDNAKAEGYIDTGVKIIIGVVVGAVILGGLYRADIHKQYACLQRTVLYHRGGTQGVHPRKAERR